MNYQHKTSRNQIPKGSVVWKILQFTFFLVACIWVLYQMRCSLHMSTAKDCDHGEKKLRERRIGEILGRKGNAGSSHNSQLKLYASNGLKVEGEEKTIDNSALKWRYLEEVSNEDGEISMEKKNADNTSEKLGNETLISEKLEDKDEEVGKSAETEVKPNVNLGAVILKTYKNGILKRDSSPSRRSDIESPTGKNTSNSGNQSRKIKACKKIILHDILNKQSLKKFQSKKGTRRELLLWLNISEY